MFILNGKQYYITILPKEMDVKMKQISVNGMRIMIDPVQILVQIPVQKATNPVLKVQEQLPIQVHTQIQAANQKVIPMANHHQKEANQDAIQVPNHHRKAANMENI